MMMMKKEEKWHARTASSYLGAHARTNRRPYTSLSTMSSTSKPTSSENLIAQKVRMHALTAFFCVTY